MYTLIATANLNDIDPGGLLADPLDCIALYPVMPLRETPAVELVQGRIRHRPDRLRSAVALAGGILLCSRSGRFCNPVWLGETFRWCCPDAVLRLTAETHVDSLIVRPGSIDAAWDAQLAAAVTKRRNATPSVVNISNPIC